MDGISDSMDKSLSKLQKMVKDPLILEGSMSLQIKNDGKEPGRDFLAGPVAGTLCFYFRACRFHPWPGSIGPTCFPVKTTKMQNRTRIVTHSVKTLKMVRKLFLKSSNICITQFYMERLSFPGVTV